MSNLRKESVLLGAGTIAGSFIAGNVVGEAGRQLVELFATQTITPFAYDNLFTYLPQNIPFYLLAGLPLAKASLQLSSQLFTLKEGNKGVARWSTVKELKKAYKSVPYAPQYNQDGTIKRYKGRSGILISRNGNSALIDTDDSHNIAIARTRGGKTTTKVLPDIDLLSRSEEQPHLVISSVKHELVEKTLKELEARGYKTAVLNLVDLDYSMGYNPLELIKEAYCRQDIDEAVELCKTFSHPLYHNPNAKDPIWEDSAMSLVNALILALCHEFLHPSLKVKRPEYVTLNSIIMMLTELAGSYHLKNSTKYMLDEYFNSLPIDNPAKIEYSTVASTDGQMRSSVFATALAKLQKFTAPKVVNLTNETTFDFSCLTQSEQPYAVYIVLPDFVETNYIIASTWIQQCYYYLSRFASEHNDRLPKRVYFELDEFGNLPPFTSLQSMVSVGAGRGMLFSFFVQDLTQFKIKYGADTAAFIESQLMNIMYISTTDDQSQKKFSKWLGDKEVIQRSRSGHRFSLRKTISESVERRPLMFDKELALLKEGECVVIRSKRVNDKFQDVPAHPIFNTGKTRLWRAHQYLAKTFIKTNYKQLPIEKRQKYQLTTSQLKEFVTTIRRRLETHENKEIREQEQLAQIEREKQEVEKQMQARAVYEWDASQPHVQLDPQQFSDQTLDSKKLGSHQPIHTSEVLDETYESTFMAVSEYLHQYFPDLLDAFDQVESNEALTAFIHSHRDKLHRFIKEVAHD